MFSDSYPIKLVDGVMYEVTGKVIYYSDSLELCLLHACMLVLFGISFYHISLLFQYISVKHGDIQLDGANPSAEDAAEETDEAVESGCDIVMAHRLAESFAFTDKKSYTQYLKEYMKRFEEVLVTLCYLYLMDVFINRLQTKMVESDPNFNLDEFKAGMNKVMKELIGRFKDLQFFTGENMDIDGMVALMEYRDVNGESRPVMLFFKHGLEAEKF